MLGHTAELNDVRAAAVILDGAVQTAGELGRQFPAPAGLSLPGTERAEAVRELEARATRAKEAVDKRLAVMLVALASEAQGGES